MKKVAAIAGIAGGAVFAILFITTLSNAAPLPAAYSGYNAFYVGGVAQGAGFFACIVFLIVFGIGAAIVKVRRRRRGY